MNFATLRRTGLAVTLLAVTLVLAGCLLSPGKFTASLDIRKDGAFGYRYTGQIMVLGLSRLARMSEAAKAKPFAPQPCPNEGDPAKHHPCTSREIDEQRLEWNREHAGDAQKAQRDAQAMRTLFGGLDMSDPKSAEELAARLRKQAGWRSVAYRGDGLYEVDFAIDGRLDRDFAFPTVERMAMANPFLTLSRRQDGTVRLDAPGFTGGASGGPFAAMMAGMPRAGMNDPGNGQPAAPWPQPEGQFTLTTDAAVLANNTDEGPQPAATGQRLQWTIGPRTTTAPMAILRIGG
ncbi:MAG: hypothetical protein KGL44_12290 [Sphingomonadales bacterium]|nr:hypothetical protein [Sphingomonadales bacterium]